jgi:hypothetical protein
MVGARLKTLGGAFWEAPPMSGQESIADFSREEPAHRT